MKKYFLSLFFFTFFMFSLLAQKSTLSGLVTDEASGEELIGATISINDQGGAVTDFDGKYSMELENGTYSLSISYVSYATQNIEISVNGNTNLDIKMQSDIVLKEVVVTADIAIERKTPVAFSNIPTRKIQEELSAQDIPMLLNSTPGVYATERGGGDGDARISIRGFDQRNVAVMLDGIPVNDMENGRVFWSNWFGLDLVTQTMQVQRGLGASKLAVPSIGGTVNILTKGIDAKRSIKFKQEIGPNGFFRSTLGLTTGRLNNGWGISLAGSYKQGNGWVDGNFTKGYFYYLRVDKQFGDHLLSFSGFGAPQEHGQRPFSAAIAQVDANKAFQTGVPQEVLDEMQERQVLYNRGRRFNEFWGMRDGEVFNTRKNFYHKPQLSLRHSWQVNSNIFWSNIAYLSIGNGGGTADEGASFVLDESGQLDIPKAIENNQPNAFNPDGLSNTIIRASKNNHFWYGLLSTIRYNITPSLTLSAGFDGRSYEGDHYREVHDLLGGSGFLTDKLQVGDRFDYDYTGFVNWLGGFGVIEYTQGKWSSFVNVSYANSKYKFLNNFTGSTVDWIDVPSTTIKAGGNFNINQQHGVFLNLGYLDKAQRWANVIISNFWTDDSDGAIAENYQNENIKAIELGYNFRSPKFSININSYYTIWGDKPLDRLPTVALDPDDPDSDRVAVNIPGIDALHKGIEIDFAFKPNKQLTIEGIASIGDWIWNSTQIAKVALPNYTYEYEFDAKGVHVGDAAQLQFGGTIRYAPIKGLYFKLKGTHFAKNYANFQPEDLQGENGGRDSWQMPNYTIFSLHTGYSFKVKDFRINVRYNVLNLTDAVYITDARNNDDFNSISFSDFDAKSASVHFGQGIRQTASIQISF